MIHFHPRKRKEISTMKTAKISRVDMEGQIIDGNEKY